MLLEKNSKARERFVISSLIWATILTRQNSPTANFDGRRPPNLARNFLKISMLCSAILCSLPVEIRVVTGVSYGSRTFAARHLRRDTCGADLWDICVAAHHATFAAHFIKKILKLCEKYDQLKHLEKSCNHKLSPKFAENRNLSSKIIPRVWRLATAVSSSKDSIASLRIKVRA